MKNTGKQLLSLLLAVCSILANINFNRIEIKAQENEKKLYMDYLAKEEKRLQKEWASSGSSDSEYLILGYKIIDLGHDGKKLLIYSSYEGGARPMGTICWIQDGKVCKEARGSAQFYRIKGSKSKIAVGGPNGASDYSYTIYTMKDSELKVKAEYRNIWDGMGRRKTYKNGKEISKKSFKRFKNRLKEIKL